MNIGSAVVTLRVMTYNVRYFANLAPVKGTASTRRGIRGIGAALAHLEALPHVVCLQEVETRSLRSSLSHDPSDRQQTQIESFMRGFEQALADQGRPHRFRAHYFPAHTYRVGRAKIYTTGLAILTRDDLQVLRRGGAATDITHRPRNRVGRYLKQSRICAHVLVQAPGGEPIDVFNTHLSLPNLITPAAYRTASRMGYGKNQAKEIQSLARFVGDNRHSDRYLVMGDFNSLPGSPAYDLITEELEVQDAFRMLSGLGVDDLRTKWPTAGFMHLRMRLDHIFAGPGLRWVDFEDTHPFGLDGRWNGLSDHVPILGRFAPRRAQVAGLAVGDPS